MPLLSFRGISTRRPGVYFAPDFSELVGGGVNFNILAVVAPVDVLPANTVVLVENDDAMVSLDPTSEWLQRAAQAIWDCSDDTAISGKPTYVLLISPQVTTQAARTYLDTGAADSLVLAASAYGPAGNRTFVTIINNAVDATARDITITRDGTTELFELLTLGNVLGVSYTAGPGTGATVAYTTAAGFVITFTKDDIAVGGATSYAPALKWDGDCTCTPVLAQSGAFIGTLEVDGIEQGTGVPVTATLTWNLADGTTPKSTGVDAVPPRLFSEISETRWTSDDGAYTGAGKEMEITGNAFVADETDFANVALFADHVNGFSDRGWAAAKLAGQLAQIPLNELDNITGAPTIFGATVNLEADLWTIIQELAASSLVTATRATGAGLPPVATGGVTALGGGTAITVTGSHWDAALTELEDWQAFVVWPYSTDATIHAKLQAHCLKMAASDERNGWYGGVANDTIALMTTRSVDLNSRLSSLVASQETLVDKRDGGTEWVTPEWFALRCAAMQASSPTPTSLLWKRPKVRNVRQHSSWTTAANAETLLKRGIVFLATSKGGGTRYLRIEDDITTYTSTEQRQLQDRAQVESFQASAKRARAVLIAKIGDGAVPSTAALLQSLLKSELEDQVTEELIKAYDPDRVEVKDGGDHFIASYPVAGLPTIRFIVGVPTATEFDFSV